MENEKYIDMSNSLSVTLLSFFIMTWSCLSGQTADSTENVITAWYESNLAINYGDLYSSSKLEIGSEDAKFSWLSYPKTTYMPPATYSNGVENQDVVDGDVDGKPIYTDLVDSLIFWKIGSRNDDRSFLIDTIGINTPVWEISNDFGPCGDSLICGKATTTWYGRDYSALYLPGVKTDVGPYKFHGLPGLLFSVQSADSIVSFSLVKYAVVENKAINSWRMPNPSKAMTHKQHKESIFKNYTRLYNEGYENAIQEQGPNAYIEKKRLDYAKEFLDSK